MPPRFEKNAPGDFYVEDGCCMTCGVMHGVAPDLIAWHKFEPDETGYVSSHCYVARQPGSLVEIAQMLDAMQISDLDCVRYSGDDPAMIAQITAIGLSDQCDALGAKDRPTSVDPA